MKKEAKLVSKFTVTETSSFVKTHIYSLTTRKDFSEGLRESETLVACEKILGGGPGGGAALIQK